jgi:hypothetical protein
MHTKAARPWFAFGVLASGPFLFGGEGQGCSPSGPPGADGGDAARIACVSPAGGPCGGNTVQPCTCSSGLTCTPVDGGPPLGDVGGTCQTFAADAGAPGDAEADASDGPVN